MGRFTRTIRGFFGRFLSGVERRNPEILLENAVQDELENLKKLQVAAARTMAYEKMLANDAVTKQKTLAVKERQARELTSRGQRDAAIEVVQQKQEAQASLADIEARSNISLSDSSRDLEKARQAIRQSSYEAEAIGELGTSETERQIAAAEVDIKRLDAEHELEMMELQMGLRSPASLEEGEPPNETDEQKVERLDERR